VADYPLAYHSRHLGILRIARQNDGDSVSHLDDVSAAVTLAIARGLHGEVFTEVPRRGILRTSSAVFG
jgi:hypothetical protein